MTLCPKTGCGQPMRIDPCLGYDAGTGLQCMRCHRCGHSGMTARSGLSLLSAGQHEFVFSYGPSSSYLKVILSTVVLNLFSGQGLTAVQLATVIAEWALVMGQVCGLVRLPSDFVLSDCYRYCQHRIRGRSAFRYPSKREPSRVLFQ